MNIRMTALFCLASVLLAAFIVWRFDPRWSGPVSGVERLEPVSGQVSIRVVPGGSSVAHSSDRLANNSAAARDPSNLGSGTPEKPPASQAAGEFVDVTVTVSSEEAFERLLRELRNRGIPVESVLPRLRTVRARVPSTDVLDDLAQEANLQLEYERVLYVYAPDDPLSFDTGSSEFGFADSALHWMGLKGDNSAWGDGVVVAVLDTGVGEHPSLNAENIRRIDLVGEGAAEGDYAGHGTAVCSIIAGNGDGVDGVAPSASILSIQVLDSYGMGDSVTLAQGIMMAVDEGADIINLSLGAEGDSQVVRDAVAYAVEQGVLVVAAAGNSGADSVAYPASYDGVIAVGSVNANGEQEDYSNSGELLDVMAPGTLVNAAWDDGEIVALSGTSSSTAFGSGTLAWLLSENPDMAPEDAVTAVLDYADDSGAPGVDPDYGNGSIDIGRLQQKDTEGIVDAALSGHYLPVETLTGDTLPIVVSAQNRGTETLPVLTVVVELAGESLSMEFSDVAPGETVSMTLSLPADTLQTAGSVELVSRTVLPDGTDANPGNDARHSKITLTTPSDTDSNSDQ